MAPNVVVVVVVLVARVIVVVVVLGGGGAEIPNLDGLIGGARDYLVVVVVESPDAVLVAGQRKRHKAVVL